MIKHFCDKCGDEITHENQFEHKEFEIAGHMITLTITNDDDSDGISEKAICFYCVLREINSLDRRPKAG